MRKFLLYYACLVVGSLLLYSCDYSEGYDGEDTRSAFVELTITMPLSNVDGAADGYESGSIYENTISDYRIYFYDYESDEFIMSLEGASLALVSGDRTNARYTITAELSEGSGNAALRSLRDFKLVMLANWETYEEPNVGSTLSELCDSEYSTYAALGSDEMDLSSSGRCLPFYGVHAYTGVTFIETGTTYLRESITLLRAVAKVELLIDNDEEDVSLVSATLHRYNGEGYCAPANVYSEKDYGQAEDWENDYTGIAMHLVGGRNDEGDKSVSLLKVQDRVLDASGVSTQKETWIAYVPEYDNSGEDYSYISIVYAHQLEGDEEYKVFFAVYDSDGTTKAYDEGAAEDEVAKRRDIHRNNLYRFNVKYTQGRLIVVPNDWEYTFDNEWTFGTMDGTGEILGNGERFPVDEIEYVVTDSESREVMVTYITNQEGVVTTYMGDIVIPEIVRYDGVDYFVVAIDEESFYYGQGITSVTIPKTVLKIGKLAFYDCDNLVSITCYNPEPPECEEDVFKDADIDTCILYVPSESVETYKATEPWSSFTNIQEIQD